MENHVVLCRRQFLVAAAVFCAWLMTVNSAAIAAEKVILVGNFTNETGDPKWNGVGVGIANSISVKLSRISSIKVTSEEARRQAMAEQRFGMTGFADAPAAAEVGKIAGATHVAYGTYTIAGDELMAFAYLVNCATALTERSCESFAYTDSTAALINELSLELAEALGADATEDELARIEKSDVGTTIDTLEMEGRIAEILFDEKLLFRLGLPIEQLNEAAAMSRQILEVEPLNPNAHSYLGTIYRDLEGPENFAKAEWHFRKVIEIDPGFAPDFNKLGELLFAMDDVDGAFKALTTAIELDPDHASTYVNLGNVKNRMGDIEGAIEAYETSLALRPDGLTALLNLGTLYKKLGDVDKAIDYYNMALEVSPDYHHAHYQLANAFYDAGDTNSALFHAIRAVDLNPRDYEAHYTLGRIYHGIEDYAAGAEALSRAVELRHYYANAWTALGLCHYKSGNTQAARAAFLNGMEYAKPGDWAYDKAAEYLLQIDSAQE